MVLERFLKYVTYPTQSDPHSGLNPSTPGQMEFARVLYEEMKGLGLSNVSLDEHGYVMGYIPSNMERETPAIGFIAHMDTSPEMSGSNVKPLIIENYAGNDIVLDKEKNIILSTEQCPELLNYTGQTIITTDGSTLLGADDKAGIAEIMTAAEYLLLHPEIKHGKICICFTPAPRGRRLAGKTRLPPAFSISSIVSTPNIWRIARIWYIIWCLSQKSNYRTVTYPPLTKIGISGSFTFAPFRCIMFLSTKQYAILTAPGICA